MQTRCNFLLKLIRKKYNNRKKKSKKNFPLNVAKENRHTRVECRFLTTYRSGKLRFILKLILPIWYVSAKKLQMSSNMSRLNITSKDTSATNMLLKTKKVCLLESFRCVLLKKELQVPDF